MREQAGLNGSSHHVFYRAKKKNSYAKRRKPIWLIEIYTKLALDKLVKHSR